MLDHHNGKTVGYFVSKAHGAVHEGRGLCVVPNELRGEGEAGDENSRASSPEHHRSEKYPVVLEKLVRFPVLVPSEVNPNTGTETWGKERLIRRQESI